MKRFLHQSCREWLSASGLLVFIFFCGYLYFSGTAIADILTVTTAGTGSGSVNSTPAGIACTSGSSTNCSAAFSNLSGVTLTATPDWKSLNGVFSGVCSGTGSCFFTIDGDTGVTASFDANYQAALLIIHPETEPKFSTLSDAYDYANTNGKNDFVLAAREYTFFENLQLTHAITFTLAGGKNSGYYTNAGYTTLNGYLEVQDGSVEIDSLIIQ